MSDITPRQVDPYRESLSTPGSTLEAENPPGSSVTINPDGTISFDFGDEPQRDPEHFENLAETLDESRQAAISRMLIDAIEVDKEARQARDSQYEEGLRRTGLSQDAPGGAPFNGASKAVHPMMMQALLDYSARVTRELMPPEGPCKMQILGLPTNDKTSRAERVSRYMNWQLTEQMPEFYAELEIGFPQEALAGAFYTKMVVIDAKPSTEVVQIDHVHRPWSDGDFYSQQRITHEMKVDRQTYEENVRNGLWRDVLDPINSGDMMEETSTESANDRVIGRDTPPDNVDDVRTVFETSVRSLPLEDEDDDPAPYLVTIDEQTGKILAIYRNWKPKDPNKVRLDFLIEWPFQPWRGGYPIGFSHMIGSLSGAATGALRALMDSALLSTTATGVKLKGGTTSGGQNIRPQPGSTVEMQGSLATDPDIRKTYAQLVFPPPSPVLFQLLGFLVDCGAGVIRTTFDEFNKMNGEMPVGTANMMIEQGLTTFGSIFARQHRAMRRFLRQLWYINQQTITNEEVVDTFGELMVSQEDFTGPMIVVPVSDPRIFTDAQRMAGAQMVAARNDAYQQKGLPSPFKVREVELNLMRAGKVAQPEQYLVDSPQPQQLNFAAENVAVVQGMPIKAFPGQDHDAHIAGHGAFISHPIFGANPAMALKALPPLINHLVEHLALWYADSMLLSTNTVLQEIFHDPRITVEALSTVKGLEVQLDRLMAELTPHVMQHADQSLKDALAVIQQAQALVKQLSPPTPMDPSVVAQQDVQRQTEMDKATVAQKKADGQLKQGEIQAKQAQADKHKQVDTAVDMKKHEDEMAIKQATLDQSGKQADDQTHVAASQVAANVKVADDKNAVTIHTNKDNNDTKLQVADMANASAEAVAAEKNASAEAIAEKAASVAKAAAKSKPTK